MTRALVLLALLPRLALAAPDAPAEGPIPTMPPPAPASYVPPLALTGEGLPAGTYSVKVGEVCYDRDAHLRLVLQIAGAEKVSDLRARESWRLGWLAGVEAMGPRVERERQAKVEAQVDAAGARTPPAVATTWWETATSVAPWILSAVLAGVVLAPNL